MKADELDSSSDWSREQEKAFENALATYPEDASDRWEKIAADVPGKSIKEIKQHYEVLVDDISQIESGRVPLPLYNSTPERSTSHASDEGVGKKTGHIRHCNSESNHGSKGSRSDQERRKGIAWTEDEHRQGPIFILRSQIYMFLMYLCLIVEYISYSLQSEYDGLKQFF